MVEQDWRRRCPAAGSRPTSSTVASSIRRPTPATRTRPTRSSATRCPAGSLSGKTVLVFKGSTGEGDCAGSTKVFNAQQAGAQAVILISLFGGAPSALATNGEAITIPVVMITANDGYAILDELSPGNPPDYNSGTVNATLNSELT